MNEEADIEYTKNQVFRQFQLARLVEVENKIRTNSNSKKRQGFTLSVKQY